MVAFAKLVYNIIRDKTAIAFEINYKINKNNKTENNIILDFILLFQHSSTSFCVCYNLVSIDVFMYRAHMKRSIT